MAGQSCARRCERSCCAVASYFPLAFVYGLTTWAVFVQGHLGLYGDGKWTSPFAAMLGVLLYALLNWSYTIAVFTSPGSPSETTGNAGYSSLPTQEPGSKNMTSLTVKSTGEVRFCKKCQARKPDRAHHCSTCQRCVMKMDHHCPWLATCVGLHNYKAFLLFLGYTCIFCGICFVSTTIWLWHEAFKETNYDDSFAPINNIMLSIISGIIGLVLTGFTAWHISLAVRGMTTIECLEKTRYLSPLRKVMRQQQSGSGNNSYGRQLVEIHANALPSVTRPEEEEITMTYDDFDSSHASQGRNPQPNGQFAQKERLREQDQYADYLDEQDLEKLPSAFDLGWRQNLLHLFGERPLYWLLPICNTLGDGWTWEVSQKWYEARDEIKREREAQWREDRAFDQDQEGFALRAGSNHHTTTLMKHLDGDHLESDDSADSRLSLKTVRRKSSFEQANGVTNTNGVYGDDEWRSPQRKNSARVTRGRMPISDSDKED